MAKSKCKSVYIAGALTDMPAEKRAMLRQFYESLAAICTEFGLEPYLPHKNSDPEHMMELSPGRVDRIDRLAVTQAYLVLAYVGVPSMGVGIEVEMAYHASKPVVLLAEKSSFASRKVTRLVRGNPSVIAEVGFIDFEDAKIQLHQFLQAFTTNISEEDLPLPLRLET